jgi:hypothetical protein
MHEKPGKCLPVASLRHRDQSGRQAVGAVASLAVKAQRIRHADPGGLAECRIEAMHTQFIRADGALGSDG